MKKLICFLFGHKEVKSLFETPVLISNKGCKRCGSPIITSSLHWKGVRSAPMPGSTQAEWDKYCDKKEDELRKQYSQ